MSTFSSTIRRILTKQTSMMTGVMTGRDPIDRDPGSQGSSAAGSQGSSAAGSQGSSAAGSQGSSAAGSQGSSAAGSQGSSAAGSQGSSAAGSQGSSAAGSQGSSAAGSQPSSRAGGLERAFELFAAAGIDFEVVPSCPVQTCEVCRQPPHLAVAA